LYNIPLEFTYLTVVVWTTRLITCALTPSVIYYMQHWHFILKACLVSTPTHLIIFDHIYFLQLLLVSMFRNLYINQFLTTLASLLRRRNKTKRCWFETWYAIFHGKCLSQKTKNYIPTHLRVWEVLSKLLNTSKLFIWWSSYIWKGK
jgi:hypothetical protein